MVYITTVHHFVLSTHLSQVRYANISNSPVLNIFNNCLPSCVVSVLDDAGPGESRPAEGAEEAGSAEELPEERHHLVSQQYTSFSIMLLLISSKTTVQVFEFKNVKHVHKMQKCTTMSL